MFDQQKYINSFIKDNYKTLKIRIRKDNKLLIQKINEVDNVNAYITSLIMDDIYKHRVYHFINNEVEIDFELPKVIQNLVNDAEKADMLNDYELYSNIVDAIDVRAKKEVAHHRMRENEWKKLNKRYGI